MDGAGGEHGTDRRSGGRRRRRTAFLDGDFPWPFIAPFRCFPFVVGWFVSLKDKVFGL